MAGRGLGVLALGIYGFVATLQSEARFGRILAASGGGFVAGSLLWRGSLRRFQAGRWDLVGSAACLLGVAAIMFGSRGGAG